MNGPRIGDDLLRDLAVAEGVCARPVLNRVTDTTTGTSRVVPIRCGATREAVCPACARRNRLLRMTQCREGWHLEHEPDDDPDDDADADQGAAPCEDVDPVDGDDPNEDGGPTESASPGPSRRVRSTRRRQDVPDLPRLPMTARTVGTAFTAGDGRVWRPSMFATFTLPSYGRVRSDGTPVDPGSYDYRAAALDAMHFPKLVDRLWQNLRRATGYRVQYFAVVEAQRRLAPHLHAAIRGAIPRAVFRQVVAATYHQVWWPAFDELVYADRAPVWDAAGYVDPDTGAPLPTWQQALDRLDADLDADPGMRPAHVVRFGSQLDVQGLVATQADTPRRVAYLTKYLTKSVADTYGSPDDLTAAQVEHLDALHEQALWLPCSPRCWNWLAYGVQPHGATAGMEPGRCPGKAHARENFGCGGRRVLVSRQWTGKTLAQHAADRATVVREALAAAGVDMVDADRMAADQLDGSGRPRYVWTPVDAARVDPGVFRHSIITAIRQRQAWRAQYEAAKARASPSEAGRAAGEAA